MPQPLTTTQRTQVRNQLAKIASVLAKLKGKMLRDFKKNYAHLKTNDFFWRYLVFSYATLGGARGIEGLAYGGARYKRITYSALKKVPPNRRIRHAEKVFRDANIRYPVKKSKGIVQCFEMVEARGGQVAIKNELLNQAGIDGKLKYLKKFPLIGDKYARNLMMDVYHPEFRDCIAIDSRIGNISKEWNISTKPYEECEEFYRSVARKAGLECWELDRLMFHFERVFYPPIS